MKRTLPALIIVSLAVGCARVSLDTGDDSTGSAGSAGSTSSSGEETTTSSSQGAGGSPDEACGLDVPPSKADHVVSIAMGEGTGCAVYASGAARCWGRWTGDGDPDGGEAPVLVSDLHDVVSIGAFIEHACALLSSGQVACWGNSHHGQLGASVDVNATSLVPVLVTGVDSAVELVVQHHQNCARLLSGEVACWGGAYPAGLGDGVTMQSQTPVLVADVHDAVAVAGSIAHNCVLRRGGEIACWGGFDTPHPTPFPSSPLPDGWRAARLSAGWDHTCALLEDGGVACWEDDNPTPSRLTNLSEVTSIAAGNGRTCAAHACGKVSCWDQGEDAASPIADIEDAVAVAGSTDHFCALHRDTSVSCWNYMNKPAFVPLP